MTVDTTLIPALAAILLLALTPPAAGRTFETRGSLQNNASLRLADYGGREYDWLNLETKLRIETRHASANGKSDAFAKVDFNYGHIAEKAGPDVRELYVNYYLDNADFRLGKQIITWGSSDLIFVTDVFPKDWTSLIVGRPMEYLKSGAEAARAQFFFKENTLEVILIPSFTPDILPGGGRLAAYNPFPAAGATVNIKPENRLGAPEAALAFSRTVGAFDYTLNYYTGRDRRPAFSYDAATGTALRRHPRMWMLGGGFKGAAGANVFRGEIAFYHTEDTEGKDAGVQNASLKYLLGLDKSLGGNKNAGVQLGQEHLMDYGAYSASLPAGAPSAKKARTFASVRLSDTWKYQTIKPKIFMLYNFTERDYFVNGEYERSLNDVRTVTLGINLFGGKARHTTYGQFDKNDNVYLNLKLDL